MSPCPYIFFHSTIIVKHIVSSSISGSCHLFWPAGWLGAKAMPTICPTETCLSLGCSSLQKSEKAYSVSKMESTFLSWLKMQMLLLDYLISYIYIYIYSSLDFLWDRPLGLPHGHRYLALAMARVDSSWNGCLSIANRSIPPSHKLT